MFNFINSINEYFFTPASNLPHHLKKSSDAPKYTRYLKGSAALVLSIAGVMLIKSAFSTSEESTDEKNTQLITSDKITEINDDWQANSQIHSLSQRSLMSTNEAMMTSCTGGSDFQVNTYNTGDQHQPSVDALESGGYVVVWINAGQSGIFAKIYDETDGVVSEFRVSDPTKTSNEAPVVAGMFNGDFVVAWTSQDGFGADSDGNAVAAKRFDSLGNNKTATFLVNTDNTLGDQYSPSIGRINDGKYMITYTSTTGDGDGTSMHFQYFYESDAPYGGTGLINNAAIGNQHNYQCRKAVAGATRDGDYIFVVYQGPDSDGDAIMGRCYTPNRNEVSTAFQVSTIEGNSQQTPSVARIGNNFVVSWETFSSNTLHYRTYESDCTTTDPDYDNVADTTTWYNTGTMTSGLADGGYVVSWGGDFGVNADVYAQIFKFENSKLNTNFIVNEYTTGSQNSPGSAGLNDGGFVIVFRDSSGRDGDGYGIFARRYSCSGSSFWPRNLVLSPSTIYNNEPSGTSAGNLTTLLDEDGFSHTFSYLTASGYGNDDNGDFTIDDNQLKTAFVSNYTAKSSYKVRVRVTDQYTKGYEKPLIVTVIDNQVPTNVNLNSTSIDENQVADTTVGIFNTTDADVGDTFSYSLVSGTGDTDNAQFNILGDALRASTSFDYETTNTYSIRVQTEDSYGCTYQKAFTINVLDINDDPTNIALNNTDINENQPSNTTIGVFNSTDQDSGDSHTYSLVAGPGDTNNADFNILGNLLRSTTVFDYETKNSYSIRVQTDDGNGGTYQKAFAIGVLDINDAPTNVTLNNTSIEENQPSDTTVGAFTSTDQDAGDSHTYSLVAGPGDTDNAQFNILGDVLRSSATFDYEAKNNYSIRVETDDGNGGAYEKAFTIDILYNNNAPTNITISDSTIDENQVANTTVGIFNTTDVDVGDTYTYTLVSGAGDTDNADFNILGNLLRSSAPFDYETKNTYSVRIETDDGLGGTYEKPFTITINDVNDDPTNISLNNTNIPENQPSDTMVGGLTTTDQDTGDSHTYSLVSGSGDTDNAQFNILGNVLRSSATFDYETKNNYTVRIETDDGNGGTYQKAFTLDVLDINDAPTNVTLSSISVDEDQPKGTVIGTFTTTDQDSGDTHTYSLVSGSGDDDNNDFEISGNQLQTNTIFDYEQRTNYTMRVETNDGNGGTYQKSFPITILDVANAAPSDITFNLFSPVNAQPAGTVIGNFTATDTNLADTFTFGFATGTGDTDNSKFNIVGNELQVGNLNLKEEKGSITQAKFSSFFKPSTAVTKETASDNLSAVNEADAAEYFVRVEANDGNGGTYQKAITVERALDAASDPGEGGPSYLAYVAAAGGSGTVFIVLAGVSAGLVICCPVCVIPAMIGTVIGVIGVGGTGGGIVLAKKLKGKDDDQIDEDLVFVNPKNARELPDIDDEADSEALRYADSADEEDEDEATDLKKSHMM